MHRVRHPNGGQIPGTQQPGQRHGITPIGLDPEAFVGEPSRLRRRLIASITSPPPIRS
jgi:hypothetical protein